MQSYQHIISFQRFLVIGITASLVCSKTSKESHINYAVQAKVIKQQHNITVIVNSKSVHLQLQHRHPVVIKTLYSSVFVHWIALSFASFHWVRRYLRFLTLSVIDLENFPIDVANGDPIRLISLVMQYRQLFHSQFCMQFSGMRFPTKVF